MLFGFAWGSVCLFVSFEIQLGLLFINQLQQLHFYALISTSNPMKIAHITCLTASIMIFLLDNLGTCIMRAFYLPDVICVAM